MKNRLLLIIAFALVLILPTISSFIKFDGPPPGYGDFPAQKVVEDPPFNQTYFNIAASVALVIVIFLVYPKLFGFKSGPSEAKRPNPATGYPSWFYPSLIVTIVSWFVMWARLDILVPIDHFAFVPLWWGFIFVLDGLVYKRTGGKSLVATRPNTLKIMAVASTFSWYVFEYLNFFVLENWYYPNNQIFTNFGNISWQLISYSTVLPAIFEWYLLLRTFKGLDEYYKYGPVIRFGTPILYVILLVGFGVMFLMGFFPFEMFWMMWVSMIPGLVPIMTLRGYWTPFTSIMQKGDYSYVVLIALATLLNGFFWEFWNFGSEWFHDSAPTNPNYWKYAIPYLDKYHIFSEMPILGYFGYMFFGIVCWVMWLAIAYIVDFNPSISLDQEDR